MRKSHRLQTRRWPPTSCRPPLSGPGRNTGTAPSRWRWHLRCAVLCRRGLSRCSRRWRSGCSSEEWTISGTADLWPGEKIIFNLNTVLVCDWQARARIPARKLQVIRFVHVLHGLCAERGRIGHEPQFNSCRKQTSVTKMGIIPGVCIQVPPNKMHSVVCSSRKRSDLGQTPWGHPT